MYKVTITNLTLANLTLTQLDAFLTAGIAAVPGAELTDVKIEVSQTGPAPTTEPVGAT